MALRFLSLTSVVVLFVCVYQLIGSIERDWNEPDRIVGELLQPGGVRALKELGIQDCIDGIDGIDCHGYAVMKPNGEEILLPYSTTNTAIIGRSLHHGRFIMNLRKAAKAAPNVTCIEGTATELISDPETGQIVGVIVNNKSTKSSVSFQAPLTVIADGCFSKFRKQFIPKDVVSASHFVGEHDTRILVDIPGKLPSISSGAMKEYLRDIVGPQLPKMIQPSFYSALETERFRSMPNSWLPPSRNRSKGVFLVGDAINMRHPLTGGGMTVAFGDIVLLRDALRSISDLRERDVVLRRFGGLHWNRKYMSSVINILANALYSLFSAKDDLPTQELQLACFAYFQLGGRCASTPVGLLAGLIHEPWTLIGHFFAVAIYGTIKIWARGPFYMFPANFIHSLLVFYRACVIIIPLIIAELRP
ncbi:hypothetical protein BSLG_006661 [Batrachochytrium salamandrivorans]|nr:hypothetical protein BSLG_006661 [Batrachochytrium salamandrivorans]